MSCATTPDGWSQYDASVPNVADLPRVVAHTAALRDRRGRPDRALLGAIRDVVVVVSSSRGGSSLFGALLRRVPGLLHLRAEINPLFALAGLHEGADRRRVLEEELLLDIGRPAGSGQPVPAERERYVDDLAWRLVLQWPALADHVEVDDLVAVVGAALPADAPVSAARDHLSVLRELRSRGLPVDPGYYDIPGALVREVFPSSPRPSGPPGDSVVEMPPFVTIDRWVPATPEELAATPVVLCTPRLSFRLGFLRELFPSARLRVVHLTRNPAAAVNGLMDGWLHHGFFNCKVPRTLQIEGYSDRVAGGRSWWCYDIPPGWQQWTEASLAEVAAFQWRATHQAAMDALDALGIAPLRLPFEDVVGPPGPRQRAFRRLEQWLGTPVGAIGAAAGPQLPVVMATQPPAPRRWEARLGDLEAPLRDPEILDLADALGYGRDRRSWR